MGDNPGVRSLIGVAGAVGMVFMQLSAYISVMVARMLPMPGYIADVLPNALDDWPHEIFHASSACFKLKNVRTVQEEEVDSLREMIRGCLHSHVCSAKDLEFVHWQKLLEITENLRSTAMAMSITHGRSPNRWRKLPNTGGFFVFCFLRALRFLSVIILYIVRGVSCLRIANTELLMCI